MKRIAENEGTSMSCGWTGLRGENLSIESVPIWLELRPSG
jgi:hypothetical protein